LEPAGTGLTYDCSMSTKWIVIGCAAWIVYASTQLPTILNQQAIQRNANLIDLGISGAGFAACAIFVAIKNAKAGS
jgi:hypothetical protein